MLWAALILNQLPCQKREEFGIVFCVVLEFDFFCQRYVEH